MDSIGTKKRYLKRYKKTMERLEQLQDKLIEIDTQAVGIGSPRITGMPGGGTPVTSADLIAEKAELEERICSLKEKAKRYREEIIVCIDGLEDPRAAMVLEMFFIHRMTFAQIAQRTSYSERQIYRHYSEGIENIELPPCQ